MRMQVLLAAGLGLLAASGCQTTSNDSAQMIAPMTVAEAKAEAAPTPALEDAKADGDVKKTDAFGKATDEALPEGVRMLGEREDPSALGASPDDDNILCKRIKVTGSRLGTQRVCKTRRQWRDYYGEANRGMRRQMDKNQKGKPQG